VNNFVSALGGMLVSALACGTAAQAATVIGAQSVTVNIGGEAGMPWVAANMINQTGLDKTYVSGVTDFDAYLASKPIHNAGAYSEWNSRTDFTSARFTVDFGSEVTIDRLAYWDEDSTSTSGLALSTADLGVFANFKVVNETPGTFGGAQVFAFRPITTRYLTFDLTGCSQGGVYHGKGCGVRELAFASATMSAVPEPGTWAMMIIGFGGTGAALRARRGKLALAA